MPAFSAFNAAAGVVRDTADPDAADSKEFTVTQAVVATFVNGFDLDVPGGSVDPATFNNGLTLSSAFNHTFFNAFSISIDGEHHRGRLESVLPQGGTLLTTFSNFIYDATDDRSEWSFSDSTLDDPWDGSGDVTVTIVLNSIDGPVVPNFASETNVDSAAATQLQSIESDGSTIVAVGGAQANPATSIVRYSTNDGVTWANGTITAAKPLGIVRHEDGVWVASGHSGFFGSNDAYIYTSSDGQTWTNRLNTGTAGDRSWGLKYSVIHDLWVFVIDRGSTPEVYTASDPTGTWTLRTLPDPGNYGDFVGAIVESDTELFIVGYGYNSAYSVVETYYWSTTNGTTWATEVQGTLNQSDDFYDMIYVPAEDVFCMIDTNNEMAYYTNSSGFPGTKTVFDTTSTTIGSIPTYLRLNDAGGVFASYISTWGTATSDGKTSYDRYQVLSGSGIIADMVQHNLQYFCCGRNAADSNAGTVWELEE